MFKKKDPLRFTGTHHDINDRKNAEHALKNSHEALEEKHRQYSRRVSILGAVCYNNDGNLTYTT